MSESPRRRPGRPRQMPAEERRALVLAAARRVFARVGLADATIGEIAREAGVTRQSVYEQFADKRAVFDATVAGLVDDMIAAFGSPVLPQSDPVDDVSWLRRIYAPVLGFFVDNPAALPLFREADRVNNETFRAYRGHLAAAYEAAIRSRAAERGLELGNLPKVLVVMFIAMSSSMLTMVADGGLPDVDILGELLSEFTIGGFEALVARPDIIERLG